MYDFMSNATLRVPYEVYIQHSCATVARIIFYQRFEGKQDFQGRKSEDLEILRLFENYNNPDQLWLEHRLPLEVLVRLRLTPVNRIVRRLLKVRPIL